MAQEPGRDKPAGEMSEDLALSRERLAQNLRGLRRELDFPRKIRRSFQTKPALWIGGAVVMGAALMLLTRGGRKTGGSAKSDTKPQTKFVTMGLAIGAMRLASSLLRPVLVNFLEKKLAGYADRPRTRTHVR